MSIVNTDTEKYISVDGMKFYEDGDIANATLTQELLKEYINPICLDIGCDKGWWSRWVSHYSPNAEIHCFEPNTKSYIYLQKEFEQRPRINVHPFAISSSNGTLKLTNEAAQSTSRTLECKGTYEEVQCKRLDTLFSPEQKFTILKIDTEGHDVVILESLLPLLQTHKIDHIISELSVYWMCSTIDEIKEQVLPIFFELLDVMPHLYLLSRRNDYLIGPITQENIFQCLCILHNLHLQTDIWFSRDSIKTSMKVITFNQYYNILFSNSINF